MAHAPPIAAPFVCRRISVSRIVAVFGLKRRRAKTKISVKLALSVLLRYRKLGRRDLQVPGCEWWILALMENVGSVASFGVSMRVGKRLDYAFCVRDW